MSDMIINALTFGTILAIVLSLLFICTWIGSWADIFVIVGVGALSYGIGWRDCKRLWVAG